MGADMGAPSCEDLGKTEAVEMRWRVLVIFRTRSVMYGRVFFQEKMVRTVTLPPPPPHSEVQKYTRVSMDSSGSD